jgi:hypothetical protein
MSEFMRLDTKAPATLGALTEAVTRLSTLSEAKILELVSTGKIAEVFPFIPQLIRQSHPILSRREELMEASPSALNRKQRRTLIQSSLTTASPKKYRPRTASTCP